MLIGDDAILRGVNVNRQNRNCCTELFKYFRQFQQRTHVRNVHDLNIINLLETRFA
ncbi:BnaC04g05130D [Brassica napus]|uniref:BnaC04g05130D protein n=1 Tax=Brassica napus TaxID=3708 RepID=A0A078IFW0_BRANA|nr:BnaC04g05130D [Brassica napus]